jgi:hypothetical protein
MTKKRKILFILISVICLITIGISCIYLKTRNTFTLKSTDLPTNDNSMAIMLETGNGTKTYKTSSDTAFPTKGYKYNAEKSYCLNGSTLTWDEANHRISTTVGGSEKCYVFFDFVPVPKFYETILANNGGATAIAAKGTPNFATAATTDEGMYAAPDDYGTSYYFRGAVSNNWVKFAGFYWRIVRINGNNTVKLVYSGTTAPTEAQKVVMTGTGTQIGTDAFNSSDNDNMYVGYKYESGNVHGLTTNSTAKTTIDSWYSSNLASQASKIADVVYCNDRSLSSGTGTGSTATDYGAYARLIKSRTPILTCPNKSDAFTVADTTHGNASLQYPVALLTADEIAMAGGASGTNNSSFYLYTNQGYWSLSPFYFDGGDADESFLDSGGYLNDDYVNYTYGLRSSISLTSDSETTGSGTWNDPYIVS